MRIRQPNPEGQQELPVQPVENPILCNPYREPDQHWVYDTATGEANKLPGRRPASYWFKTRRTSNTTLTLPTMAEEQRDDLPLVNALRSDVRRWRENGYRGATPVTKGLLAHWWREDRPRRLFFCQLEAVETVIYLVERRARGGAPGAWRQLPGFQPDFTDADYDRLVDTPAEAHLLPLIRYGSKMATGSGKTVVMAMLIAWAFCNRGRVPSAETFPRAALVCCPNLTVKERLQVLRPEHPDNYYSAFDLVPAAMRPLLQSGKVLVSNWHAFAPESEHAEGGKSYAVVNKGPESPEAFARRVLGELYDLGPLMVLNDEAHHAYRPAPLEEQLAGEEARRAKSDREEATIWISGLDRINQACGIRFCADLSATPFYLQGSGHIEGAPLPWLVSDFALVDAIESGITKIPRLPVASNTGRPEPEYFKLWEFINSRLQPADRLPGRARKPKPEVVWREAEGALKMLMGQWAERFSYIREASDAQDKAPPVLIIVCDNTDIAEVFYRSISGETQTEVVTESAADDEEEAEGNGTGRRAKKKTVVSYGAGKVFPELFSNRPGFRPTVRIDSKLLEQAESEDPNANRRDAAEELRRLIGTVGKPGEPGEQVRCVVSVAMLTEGWDANNVTHILGLRAFGSQLLCEQVVGRGLRRMDYTPDPETGLLTEEYVDVYGIPFSLIPYKGRETKKPAPEDRPKNHVRALPERAAYKMDFPVVEGYVFALTRNAIRADLPSMESLEIQPSHEPTSVFVKPTVGYQERRLSSQGPGAFEMQNRKGFYESTHLQTIQFEIARQIVAQLVGDGEYAPSPHSNARLRLQSRHQLFPQVLRLVDGYVRRKVDFHGQHPCELGLEKYVTLIVERLVDRIEPDDDAGEPPLMPLLNRYKPIGTTAEVDFKTIRPCHGTERSHLNQVVVDTATWESSAGYYLEEAKDSVAFYARNDQMGFVIPYTYMGVNHSYEPDYLVRLVHGVTVILEIKGAEHHQDQAKHEAARRWVSAVNNWGKLGRWEFHVCRDPHLLERELRYLLQRAPQPAAA